MQEFTERMMENNQRYSDYINRQALTINHQPERQLCIDIINIVQILIHQILNEIEMQQDTI